MNNLDNRIKNKTNKILKETIETANIIASSILTLKNKK